MQTSYIRNKLNLHWPKIIFALVALICLSREGLAQKKRWVNKNNPTYDDRKITYGFLIGLHTTTYQIKYADRFVTQDFDTVYTIDPGWSPGFSLGFIVNYRVTDLLDLRITPKVAFY